jgi:hypothetical protein
MLLRHGIGHLDRQLGPAGLVADGDQARHAHRLHLGARPHAIHRGFDRGGLPGSGELRVLQELELIDHAAGHGRAVDEAQVRAQQLVAAALQRFRHAPEADHEGILALDHQLGRGRVRRRLDEGADDGHAGEQAGGAEDPRPVAKDGAPVFEQVGPGRPPFGGDRRLDGNGVHEPLRRRRSRPRSCRRRSPGRPGRR